jgi:subtilase family serine protease
MEELESRLLLSAVPVAHTTFTIHHGTGVVHPFDYSSPVGLTPSQIEQAYGMNAVQFGAVTGNGSGQTIAIVDAYNDPTIVADLHAFDAQFGLSNPTFTVVGQNGSTTLPGTDPEGPGNSWAVETSMDVEWAHAAAPGANIVLVEASSDSDTDLFSAVSTAKGYAGVSVVSMSWGESEFPGETAYDSTFTTPAGHNGVTFVASSGDQGAYGTGAHTIVADYPSSSPNVISAGGTTLTIDGNNNYVSETGWGNGSSSGRDGGSGGGISRYETQPAYQKGVVTQSTTYRTTPDVSLDADPNSGVAVYDSYDFGSSQPWAQIGGTSLAAPLWAGVIAIADQGAVLGGGSTFTSTQALTKLYSLPTADFHDITTGNNGYAAGAGYDLVTGRGSPIVNLVAEGMAGPITPVPVIASLTGSPTSGLAGTSVTLTASNVHESSGSSTIGTVTFYLESNGTAGLQTSGDTLLGTGTQNGTTWTYTFDTTGLATGTYTFYATATDSGSVTSAASSTTFQVVTPVPVVGSLAASPTSGLAGTAVTLTASNVHESLGSPTISTVTFYRESNGTAGLQTTGTADTLLGTGTQNGTTWTYSFDTTGLAAGACTFYAVATDSDAVVGAAVSTVFTVTLPAPVNDLFANATVLTGTTATATGNNATATKESGEPNIAGNQGGKSVWWAWTAPVSGTVQINTEGSKFDTLLGVYTGSVVSALTTVAQNDDVSHGDLTSAVSFSAVAGTTYYIAVDGYNYGHGAGAASGNIALSLTEILAPANDNFASAQVLTGTTATATGTNTAATKEPGEPNILANLGGKSVWYAWTAPSSGTVKINTEGSNFDTMMGVYTGSTVSALTTVAQNDDVSRRDLTSAVSFTAVAGTTYYIQIDGYNSGRGAASGNITLNLTEAQAPANDLFASATVLTGPTASWTGSNAGATREPGEPSITGNMGGASIWFAWTAPSSGSFTVNTEGSNFDTMLGVYTGSVVSALTTVGENDDISRRDLTSAVTFAATAGTTYYFAVDGYNNGYGAATGTVVLNLAAAAGQPVQPITSTGPGGGTTTVGGPGGGFGWTPWW